MISCNVNVDSCEQLWLVRTRVTPLIKWGKIYICAYLFYKFEGASTSTITKFVSLKEIV